MCADGGVVKERRRGNVGIEQHLQHEASARKSSAAKERTRKQVTYLLVDKSDDGEEADDDERDVERPSGARNVALRVLIKERRMGRRTITPIQPSKPKLSFHLGTPSAADGGRFMREGSVSGIVRVNR